MRLDKVTCRALGCSRSPIGSGQPCAPVARQAPSVAGAHERPSKSGKRRVSDEGHADPHAGLRAAFDAAIQAGMKPARIRRKRRQR